MTLHFTAIGVPQQAGSKRAFLPKGRKYPIVTDSNRNLRSWQQLVAEAAQSAILEVPADDRALMTDGGVRLTLAFYLPRPKSLGANVTAHTKAPDLDKFVRAVQDALTAVVYRDDAQVVDLVAMKRYAAKDAIPRAEIWIEPTEGLKALARNQHLFAKTAQQPLFEEHGRNEHG